MLYVNIDPRWQPRKRWWKLCYKHLLCGRLVAVKLTHVDTYGATGTLEACSHGGQGSWNSCLYFQHWGSGHRPRQHARSQGGAHSSVSSKYCPHKCSHPERIYQLEKPVLISKNWMQRTQFKQKHKLWSVIKMQNLLWSRKERGPFYKKSVSSQSILCNNRQTIRCSAILIIYLDFACWVMSVLIWDASSSIK